MLGRRLFDAKVPTEAISKFLGHESTTETLSFIRVLSSMNPPVPRSRLYPKPNLAILLFIPVVFIGIYAYYRHKSRMIDRVIEEVSKALDGTV